MSDSKALPKELAQNLSKWKKQKGSLIIALREVQDYYGCVPLDICMELAKELKIPLVRIYEVLTFYNYFKLEASGKYKIYVCMGTACYLKGAQDIIKIIEDKLNIKEGKLFKESIFTLESVRCMGCCGLAPTMRINDTIYGKLTKEKVIDILDEYIARG